ncbi:MAG: heavy metal translocating P-type ATPase metal-binding domain-containing protein [Bacteroidia bacterium]|nr:heavy metal translocating P-type ATPase metal-binding domain-containing protein [Bacteroidia bacterium]
MEQRGQLHSPEITKGTEACYHCGEPCEQDTIVFKSHSFCCKGCKLVYEILDENKLCTYYAMGEGVGNSPDPDLYKDKFSYLDQPEIRNKLLQFNSATQCHVSFFVPGMHCSSCIWLLENFRKLDPGVISSSVNFPNRTISLVYNPALTSLAAIASRMSHVGYQPHISLDAIEKKNIRKLSRQKWAKVGVAGFCFGNIMMLSFPEYFAISGVDVQPGLKWTFSLLNLALSLPVLLYSSRDFFISALGAIRSRHLNIDLPLAAAILITFIRSVYELASGTGPGYFDSMAGIVFFMLVGRAFQDRTFETMAFDRDYRSYFPLAVSVVENETIQQVQVSKLKSGMRMRIRNREVIPADAILLSDSASIDYSFVTGEARPEPIVKGDLIYAGGRQLGTAIDLEVVSEVEQSYLTRLWNNSAFTEDENRSESGMVNRINQYFTAVVFVLAVLAAGYWYWQGAPILAWNAVTTILIVACPCILLLAATFTNGHVLRILAQNGLYLKHPTVIEKLGNTDTLVFDKTGTITPGRDSKPLYEGKTLNATQFSAIASLVAQSNHPLSRRIGEAMELCKTTEIIEFDEVPGLGLQGYCQGELIQLGSAAFTGALPAQDTETSVFLSINKEPFGRFVFRNKMREGLAEQMAELEKNHQIYLVSGDHSADKSWLSTWFKDERMHFRYQPEDKLNFIKNLKSGGKNTLMLGDGLNDAGALRESTVGIAVSDDVNNFSPACDGIIQGESMGRLSVLLRFSRHARTIIAWSFIFSIVYNIIGLSFALRGALQPVIAAILMPAASISIVALATLLTWLTAKRMKLA